MNTNKNAILNPKANTKKEVPPKVQPKKVVAQKNPTKVNQPQKIVPKKITAPKVEAKKPVPKTNVKTGGQNQIQGKKVQAKVSKK